MLDPSRRTPPDHLVTATIDGAARGNPGPAAYGVIFEDHNGAVKAQLASRLGKTTNNVAEYRALLAAVNHAREQGWRALKVRTDSELLARQLQGRYKVKSPDLKPLHAEAQQIVSSFDYFSVEAVPRKLTRAADKLANAALDGRPVPTGKRHKKELSQEASATGPNAIRVVYQDGVLKPLKPLDLPDGAEVEVTVMPRRG